MINNVEPEEEDGAMTERACAISSPLMVNVLTNEPAVRCGGEETGREPRDVWERFNIVSEPENLFTHET